MSMGKRMQKERTNWCVTIILFICAALFIFGPLYLTLMIALKAPTDMNNVFALPKRIAWENFAEAWRMTEYPKPLVVGNCNLYTTVINNPPPNT